MKPDCKFAVQRKDKRMTNIKSMVGMVKLPMKQKGAK